MTLFEPRHMNHKKKRLCAERTTTDSIFGEKRSAREHRFTSKEPVRTGTMNRFIPKKPVRTCTVNRRRPLFVTEPPETNFGPVVRLD